MSDLINSITALCKFIDCAMGITLRPDLFRLLMINKLDANEIQLMVSVLHNLCCASLHSACEESPSKCISSYMMEEGGTVAFLLSPDAPPVQILLCLAWLISHGALENMVDNIILQSPLGQEVLNQAKDDNKMPHPITPLCEQVEDLVNYTTFLAGKINHNLKAIRSYREEKIRLYSKVASESAGFQSLPYLSVVDVQLSKCPVECADFLLRCQPCLRVIEAYLKWQRRSHFFWQWMDSILKEQERLSADKIQKKENIYKAMSMSEVDHLNRFLKNLEENVHKRAKEEPKIPLVLNSCTKLDIRKLFLSCEGHIEEMENIDAQIKSLSEANDRKVNELIFKLEKRNIQEIDQILLVVKSCLKQNSKIK